jgi:catechol 2,3-dioxygenase-like lactoylglutathione lyase family enzyme
MQQQISVITVAVKDLARSKRFYMDGFGWKPVFEVEEIVFYQMNGLMLGTWLDTALAADIKGPVAKSGGFTIAHNVPTKAEVQPLLDRLAQHGGEMRRVADDPPHGGTRGYVADPDGHVWEVAWNPAWKVDAEGHFTFGV